MDPERIARVIRALDPDILALQEVDSRRRGADGREVFAYLKETIGGHAIDAKAISTVDGHYGQMLISRWPLREHRVHDISVGRREPRRVLEARVDCAAGPLRVFATHLGLQRAERRAQLRALAGIATKHATNPRVLLGDLNDWRRRGAGFRKLSPLFGACTWLRTFPARLPLVPLDRIWCEPAELLTRAWTEPTARDASDHLLLAADLDLHAAHGDDGSSSAASSPRLSGFSGGRMRK